MAALLNLDEDFKERGVLNQLSHLLVGASPVEAHGPLCVSNKK